MAESTAVGRDPRKRRQPEGRVGGAGSDPAKVKSSDATQDRTLLGPVRLLPTPPEVERAMEREVEEMAAQGRPVVGVALERLLEGLKLRYYFGGQPFAYRETDLGKEVLAVGFKDMGRLFGDLSPEEDEAITSGFAEPW